jgi:hypothetical protein
MVHVVRRLLESIRWILVGRLDRTASEDLIQDHVAVSCAGCTLQACMGLQKEIPVANFSDAAIDNSSGLAVGRAVGVRLGSRIKARMMSLAARNDRDLGESLIRSDCGVLLPAGISD